MQKVMGARVPQQGNLCGAHSISQTSFAIVVVDSPTKGGKILTRVRFTAATQSKNKIDKNNRVYN